MNKFRAMHCAKATTSFITIVLHFPHSLSSGSTTTAEDKMTTSSENFPSIQTGGSLLLAWQLKQKNVLIVGGGNVAADRIRSVLAAWDATTRSPHITLVSPSDGLNDEVKHRLQQDWGIRHIDRQFMDEDVQDKDMVLTATDDSSVSEHVHALCKAQRIVVNVADVPPLCDFYFGSVIQRGPLQIMVSTNGKSPRLANRLRREIQAQLPDNVEGAIQGLGKLRAELRGRSKAQEESPRRMEWMIQQTDAWTLNQLAELDEHPEWRQYILDEGWRRAGDNKVITYGEATGKRWSRIPSSLELSSLHWPSVAIGFLASAAVAGGAWLRFARS